MTNYFFPNTLALISALFQLLSEVDIKFFFRVICKYSVILPIVATLNLTPVFTNNFS